MGLMQYECCSGEDYRFRGTIILNGMKKKREESRINSPPEGRIPVEIELAILKKGK